MENIFELLSSGSFIAWLVIIFLSIVAVLVVFWFALLLYINISFRSNKLTNKDFNGSVMSAINNQLYKDTFFDN